MSQETNNTQQATGDRREVTPLVEGIPLRVRPIQGYEGGHCEAATNASRIESPTKYDLNSRYGVIGRVVRPMIQFVPTETFEARTAEACKKMTVVRSRDTIKRNGWYYTEKCTPEEYPVGA